MSLKSPSEDRSSGYLSKIYMLGMILERYRSDIIGYDIRAGQSFSITFSQGGLVCIGVIICGYVVPGSVESYFHGWYTNILILISFLPLVGLSQTTLTEINSQEVNSASKTEQAIGSVYGYVRQSQTDEDESASIQSQKQTAEAAAKEEGYDSLTTFVDKNESGFSFERSGFNNLIEQLERDPRPVCLDRVDRLGRDTLETIFVAAEIHYEYEVSIITAKHGQYDLDEIDDQLDLVLNAIIAGKSVKNRVRAAWESIQLRFTDERKWNSWFNNIPVGYQSDDENWIEPAPHATDVITAISHDLLETETRTTTIERLRRAGENNTLGQQETNEQNQEPTLANIEGKKIKSVFDKSDYDLSKFDASQLKRLLTNHVLVGEVRYPRSVDYEEQTKIEEPDLQVIDKDLFERVNDFLDEQASQNSTDTDASVTMDSMADHGMILLAIDTVDVIKPVCPECNRGMVRNGEDKKNLLGDGRLAHYWICPKYNEEGSEPDLQRKVPYTKEWEAIQNDLEDSYKDHSDIVLLKICPPQEKLYQC